MKETLIIELAAPAKFIDINSQWHHVPEGTAVTRDYTGAPFWTILGDEGRMIAHRSDLQLRNRATQETTR